MLARDAFSHDSQRFEPASFTIIPGDSLRTTCCHDTTEEDAPVRFGAATTDEMCMQVFLCWPKQPTFLCGHYAIGTTTLPPLRLRGGVPPEVWD